MVFGILNPGDPSLIFDLDIPLGQGTYGEVFRGKHKQTHKDWAIKLQERLPVDEDMVDLEQEILILRSCNHSNICGFLGAWLHERHRRIWVVLEYCSAGSIADVIVALDRPLNSMEIAAVLHGTAQGLAYLHEHRVLHRDIKAANLLLTEAGHVKIADFGVAAVLTDARPFRTTAIGAPYWLAPEVVEETKYGTACDIWSLGITLIELAERQPPFSEVHPMRAIFMIPSHPAPKLKLNASWPPSMHDLLSVMCVKAPAQRCTAKDVLSHAFLQSFPAASSPEKVMLELVRQAMPIIRDIRRDEPDIGGIAAAARDKRVKSIKVKKENRVASSVFDTGRSISDVFNPRSRAGTKSSRSLLSVSLNPNHVEDLRRSVDPRLARQGEILTRAGQEKKINVNDVFELLAEQPLSPEEKESGRNILKFIETAFMESLEEMI